jgi:hypothetical protein
MHARPGKSKLAGAASLFVTPAHKHSLQVITLIDTYFVRVNFPLETIELTFALYVSGRNNEMLVESHVAPTVKNGKKK